MNRLQESGAGAESNHGTGLSDATTAPTTRGMPPGGAGELGIDGSSLTAPKSIFILEAEAVEATLKLWLGLGLPSAVRVATMAMNHLQEQVNALAKR